MQLEGDIATIRQAVGARIKFLRETQGMSQHVFASMIGMDRSYFIGVEKGRRNISIDNLIRIAQGFDIPLSELFLGVDD